VWRDRPPRQPQSRLKLSDPTLLQALESYYDAIPRAAARVDQIGPFTLFARPAWRPSYARPSLGAHTFSVDDVQRVRARQRALGRPEAFEWVTQTTPGLASVLRSAGLEVNEHPLMVLTRESPAVVVDAEVRLATNDDDVARLSAVADLAFATPGTRRGPVGLAEVAQRAMTTPRDPAADAFDREQRRSGRLQTALALVDGQPVGVGSHLPLGEVAEIAGVGVLPAFRRRGLGAALTAYLAGDARARGIRIVFLTAGDPDIARVYARVGFETLAVAGTAEPARRD
jgi:GNAT superfamily N-acetyltransferase